MERGQDSAVTGSTEPGTAIPSSAEAKTPLGEDIGAQTLAGGGEMGALMRALDWATTPIGPVEDWPQSLRTAVSICLSSRFPILIWWGPELVMLYNDAYRPMLGQTKHPGAMGQRGRECWPEIWDLIGPMLTGVLASGEATWSDDQLLLLDRNGYVEECYFTFSYSPIRDESGSVGGVFTAVTETTARVLGERRLRTLRDLAVRTADAHTVENACACALEALRTNPADIPFAALYLLDDAGQEARLSGEIGPAAGTALSPLAIPLAETPHGLWPFGQVARTGQAMQVEVPALSLDQAAGSGTAARTALVLPIAQAGQEHLAGLLVAGINPRHALDDDYRAFYALVAGHIATAIADARAYEEERKRAEALAELDRAKTAFFSNVSHEFRTPLTLLLGPLEEALAHPADTTLVRQNLEIAQRNSLRLLRLVNTLLDFSRMEAGRVEASYEPTDLATYTAELAGVFRSAVERAGLRLLVECPPLPQPVYVDREMWEKIVLNLLSNAFKFTLEGQIAVTLRAVDGQVTLAVRDTGTGIPAEELPHLFERFHRVRGARARTHEGTGIGLALVQDLVRLHGGEIGVQSTPGVGSTFTVTLPLGAAHLPAARVEAARTQVSTALGYAPYVAEALRWLPPGAEAPEPPIIPDVTAAAAKAGANGDRPRARVLLADDNADLRDYATRLLGRDYAVQAVTNGAEALNAARAEPPDLVLADVMMPALDGFELLRELRADSRTSAIPVVLLSARAGEEAAVEGLQAGADDYLVKPFSARELLARVRTHVELARLRTRLLAETEAARAAAEEVAQQVRDERDRLRQILDVLPEGVAIVDAQGQVEALNQAGREIVGLDTRGRRIAQSGDVAYAEYGLRYPDGTPYAAEQQPLTRSLRHGEVVQGDQETLRHAVTGRDVPLLVNSAPLRDAAGAIVGAVAVFQDITALKDLERVREEFLAAVAHDLKTPLTGIRGHAQLARRRLARLNLPEAARVVEHLAQIDLGVSRMLDLTNELVDMTRAQLGYTLPLDRQPTDLIALVRGVVAQHEGLSDHRLHVETVLPALQAPVDAARIERVVGNLLSNATKYSPHGGEIAVQVARQQGLAGPLAVIAVHDAGIGIPAADLPHVFERFWRARNVEEHIPGTGIGLASALQIVTEHGGTIDVSSQEGQGSTFTVRLPLTPLPEDETDA